MATLRPSVCIYCWKSADLRTGTVDTLPNAGRIHKKCVWPLLNDLAKLATDPRDRRPVAGRIGDITQRRPPPRPGTVTP